MKYLAHIERVWNNICKGEVLRVQDVHALEKRCPRFSERDSKQIEEMTKKRVIFPHQSDEWRTNLLQRLNSINTLIPSLTTFFEDFKLLEQCKYCFKHIIIKEPSVSIRCSLVNMYRGAAAGQDMAYFRLWLYVVQNWRQMRPPPSRDSSQLLANRSECYVDERKIYLFAMLAADLGFKSAKIECLVNTVPERNVALNCLFSLRPPEYFNHQELDISSVMDSMLEACQRAEKVYATPEKPNLVGRGAPPCLSGFPKVASYENDRKYLDEDSNFDFEECSRGETVTSFFQLKSICILWFQSLPPPPIQRPKTGFGSPISEQSREGSFYDNYACRNPQEQIVRSSCSEYSREESPYDGDDCKGQQLVLAERPDSDNDSASDIEVRLDRENEDEVHLSDRVFVRQLLPAGDWKIISSFTSKEAALYRQALQDKMRELHVYFGGIAYVAQEEERLYFILPEKCVYLINEHGVRNFIVPTEHINSRELIESSRQLG